MKIRTLFHDDVTRDIPPVVYFHEQSPKKLEEEVSEYIITGGWQEGHPNHRRVPNGIHEQYVRLLNSIARELDKPSGPELPNVWISGFYGSGKSSFAKLLGLALDGVELPDGTSLSSALLARDTSDRSAELTDAWANLRKKVDPVAVVFDIGAFARDNEHVHAVAVRRLQERLGYSTKSAHIAYGELEIERDGRWEQLLALCVESFDKPWEDLKNSPQAPARFSKLMSLVYPEIYASQRDWHLTHAGSAINALSPEDAISSIRDMLQYRSPRSTVFFVIDEVSQYVIEQNDRVERLRAFASALGAGLKGAAWLLALGQQQLEEDADASFLVKTKDRFPPHLRVHLAATNIRDVVHRRLLRKKPPAEVMLRDLFNQHRADLKLFAYGCAEVTPDEFVETYPLLPGQIDLVLKITSALRSRSTRAQGDDHTIRGLLQLLGELFNGGLAEADVGALITLDQIYDVQQTALDSDTQNSMRRILDHCANHTDPTLLSVAKAVSLLELISDTEPTTAEFVARCLFDRLDRGGRIDEVTDALESLRHANLLGYSEKTGYKIQSSAGEEWERERREHSVPREAVAIAVQKALEYLAALPDRPRYQGRSFPWGAVFSDGRRIQDASLIDPRDPAQLRVDFRFLPKSEQTSSTWVKRSDETELRDRLVWVGGDPTELEAQARQLLRSEAMVRKYQPRAPTLNPNRQSMLHQERAREEELRSRLRQAVEACWMSGQLYFRGRPMEPHDRGATFAATLEGVGGDVLRELFPHYVPIQVQPSEIGPLLEPEVTGPAEKFLSGDGRLGILETDSGRYVPTCGGVVPMRVLEFIQAEKGVGGTTLLAHFGAPPFGHPNNVVRACIAGLLRAGKIRIQPESGPDITAVRDAGVRDLFKAERAFRRALFFSAKDEIGFKDRARVCQFFKNELDVELDREDTAIADAVAHHFPAQAARLRDVLSRLQRLPVGAEPPGELNGLQEALEQCLRQVRQTKPTVRAVVLHLDALRDGLRQQAAIDTELNATAVDRLVRVYNIHRYHAAQLRAVRRVEGATDAAERVASHLDTARPWQGISTLDADLDGIREVYKAVRTDLIRAQERATEDARVRIKGRTGFSTLSSDDSHHVLRPIHEAAHTTDVTSTAPTLADLDITFQVRLREAEEEANERLDELLSRGEKPLIKKVPHRLKNREITSAAELDTVLDELRARVLAQLAQGGRVRLI